MSVEARRSLTEIQGSLAALAGHGEGTDENPVLQLLELLVTLSEGQSRRLDRIENEIERIADAVAPRRT